jgi:hypothetical protein
VMVSNSIDSDIDGDGIIDNGPDTDGDGINVVMLILATVPLIWT